MSGTPQSFESHARLVPLYHYVTLSLLAVPTLFFGYRAVTAFSLDALMLLLLALGVNLAAFFARTFPLGVQDRVIRLEERMRMERLFPDDLRARIGDFSTEQLIALRFASDAELVELSRRVLDDGMPDRKAIKRAVKSWRADHQRI